MSFKANWDAFGIIASVACAIHCVALPVLITVIPWVGNGIVKSIAFEYFMIAAALVLGILALSHGYRKHHRKYLPALLFIFGMMLLFAGHYWHDLALWILPIALLLVVSAHLMNFRLCRLQGMPSANGEKLQQGQRTGFPDFKNFQH